MISPTSPPPKWSRRPPEPSEKRGGKWKKRLFVLAVSATTIACILFWLQSRDKNALFVTTSAAPPVTVPAKPERLVSLFFPLVDGSGLAGVIRKRPDCPDEVACLQDLLHALGENPGNGLFPLLPPQSDLRLAGRIGTTATINFSQKTVQHIMGGIRNERLLLTALVNTLAVNFPQIEGLLIQIDGMPAETLKGHIDLSTPFGTDFTFVRSTPVKSPPSDVHPPSKRSQSS